MIPQREAIAAHGLDRKLPHADAPDERASLAPEATRGTGQSGSHSHRRTSPATLEPGPAIRQQVSVDWQGFRKIPALENCSQLQSAVIA